MKILVNLFLFISLSQLASARTCFDTLTEALVKGLTKTPKISLTKAEEGFLQTFENHLFKLEKNLGDVMKYEMRESIRDIRQWNSPNSASGRASIENGIQIGQKVWNLGQGPHILIHEAKHYSDLLEENERSFTGKIIHYLQRWFFYNGSRTKEMESRAFISEWDFVKDLLDKLSYQEYAEILTKYAELPIDIQNLFYKLLIDSFESKKIITSSQLGEYKSIVLKDYVGDYSIIKSISQINSLSKRDYVNERLKNQGYQKRIQRESFERLKKEIMPGLIITGFVVSGSWILFE